MPRYIDADALLTWFDEHYDDEDVTVGYVTGLIKDAPTIEPEPHWIPCSERLPDNDESVLISNSHGVTKAWWNGRFWSGIAVKKYKTVTAWMPLPEPYKEETNA